MSWVRKNGKGIILWGKDFIVGETYSGYGTIYDYSCTTRIQIIIILH
jgi:hypothetical protein